MALKKKLIKKKVVKKPSSPKISPISKPARKTEIIDVQALLKAAEKDNSSVKKSNNISTSKWWLEENARDLLAERADKKKKKIKRIEDEEDEEIKENDISAREVFDKELFLNRKRKRSSKDRMDRGKGAHRVGGGATK